MKGFSQVSRLYRPNYNFRPAVIALTIALVLTPALMNAQAKQSGFVPFQNFVEQTKSANAGEYMAQESSKVKDAASFEEMRQHILKLYDGVQVTHSFVLDGDPYDCVPIMQQPGVRSLGLNSIASPPPANALAPLAQVSSKLAADKPNEVTSQLAPDQKFDSFGNSLRCEANSIPMRRVTLDEVSRFSTLRNYFEKGPNGAGQVRLNDNDNVLPADGVHKYSHANQYVNNLGQTATINLWSPYVNTGLGEIFSLAQSWTVAFAPATQTAEVGWQNYPNFYNGQNSRLFIYWTADGYSRTGCYNLSCGAFVQVNGGWYFGGGFSNYSTFGGAQWEFTAQYYWYQGNWWLGLGNPNSITWVGYYPATLYGSGPMRTHAQLIDFGSESDAYNPWPPEGSGGWASWGWTYAGYQRQLYYWAYPSAAAYWDSLSPVQSSSNCYTIAGPYWGGWNPPSNNWGIYFYFGGPGGYNCY